ncbi:YtxH domain-containing protein [Fodinibius salsisoli]|uniref:YtxH domain-containing protein n=1 Tax=Fodinibius salsisoli TaxID=2820877 RepID=A0ABT3PRS3_9BACT|nr:YtxH domain-containing protein [Fodinibius salsisoli]MCW9708560.1 YtxH domain-containing protein [Fodinibius salsisoli]
MTKRSSLRSLLLATGSFIGGVTLGVLLTPRNGRETRHWVSSQASELSDWMSKHHRTARQKGETELHNIRQNVHKGLRRNIPDLYEATENIDLSDDGLTGA